MKGLTGSSYSKLQRLSSFKTTVSANNWCYSVQKSVHTTTQNINDKVLYNNNYASCCHIKSATKQSSLENIMTTEVKKTKNYIRRNFMVYTWHSGLNGNYNTWVQKSWKAKWGGQEPLRLGLCKWAVGLVQN